MKIIQEFDIRQKGSCMLYAEKVNTALMKKGINNYKVVEGYVRFKKGHSFTPTIQHTWIEFDDGRKIDKTKEQFNEYDLSSIQYIKRNAKIYSPQEYSDLCKKYPVDAKGNLVKSSIQEIKYRDFFKYLISENTYQNPSIFYHATYKPLLNKIKKFGLRVDAKKRWSDSKNVIYLSSDPDVAASYAESADDLPDGWEDQIIILKIEGKHLNQSKIFNDSNVRSDESSETFEYHENIPFSSISNVSEYN